MHTSQRHLNTESNETRSGDQRRITHCAKVGTHALTLDRRASCGTAHGRTQYMTYQLAHGITMLSPSHVRLLREYKYPRSFTYAGLREQPAIQCAAHPNANQDILHAWLTAERTPCEPGVGVTIPPTNPQDPDFRATARESRDGRNQTLEEIFAPIWPFSRTTGGSDLLVFTFRANCSQNYCEIRLARL